jgi:hypothetical protein
MMSIRTIVFALTAAVSPMACTPEPETGTSGGNTNWLKQCDSEAECGAQGACVEGVCLLACARSGGCGSLVPAAECVDSSERVSACPMPAQPLCMPICSNAADCRSLGASYDCRGGTCQPSCDDAAQGAAGGGGVEEGGVGGAGDSGTGGVVPTDGGSGAGTDEGTGGAARVDGGSGPGAAGGGAGAATPATGGDAGAPALPASAKYKYLPEEVVAPAATRLEDDSIFFFGQRVNDTGITAGPRVAYRYDPASDEWTALPGPTDAAASQGYPPDCFVFALPDLRVLEVDSVSGQDTTARIYDVKNETWQATPLDGYLLEQVVALDNGDALAVLTDAVHRFDAVTSSWAAVESPPYEPVYGATARLSDGRVLNVSGSAADAALFDPETNRWQAVAPPRVLREYASLVGLSDGRALLVGGVVDGDTRTTETQTEVFDPGASAWQDGPKLTIPQNTPALEVVGDIVRAWGGLYAPCDSAIPCGGVAVQDIDVEAKTVTELPELSFPAATVLPFELSSGRYVVIGSIVYGWYDAATGARGTPF